MGPQKQRWTPEEEEALRAGVFRYGTGKWKVILTDPDFATALANRSNIDLKDKWRNLSVSANAQGSREKSRSPNVENTTIGFPLHLQNSIVAVPVPLNTNDPSSSTLRRRKRTYSPMIFEALSSMRNSDGVDINTIVRFIEQKREVPQHFKRLLSTKLRRLVQQGKLEKVENCYKIKDAASAQTPHQNDVQNPMIDDATPVAMLPAPQQEDVILTLSLDCNDAPKTSKRFKSLIPIESLEVAAARQMAEADHKLQIAVAAVKEADKLSRMAEKSEALLSVVTYIYEECARGNMIMLY